MGNQIQYPKPKRYIEKKKMVPVYDCPGCPGVEIEGKRRYREHQHTIHSEPAAVPKPEEEVVQAQVIEEEEIIVAKVIEE